MHPALGRKVSGRHPGTGPVMGGGGGPLPHHVPPPPVRTVDKEWKDRVSIHCKKRVSRFPVPSRDVTNQTLPGLVII
jgi:hypothetical protein